MMNFLLDTHVFLWFVFGNNRLSATARSLIEAGNSRKFLSILTPWEIAIKASLGKLTLAQPLDVLLAGEISGRFDILPIEIPHILELRTLPHHHRDPFDRMLIAQAVAENLPIISADTAFDAYPIRRIW